MDSWPKWGFVMQVIFGIYDLIVGFFMSVWAITNTKNKTVGASNWEWSRLGMILNFWLTHTICNFCCFLGAIFKAEMKSGDTKTPHHTL